MNIVSHRPSRREALCNVPYAPRVPQHNFEIPRGRVEYLTIESSALADNRLGDPATRGVAVYLPAGYDDAADELPLLVALAPYTGSGLKLMAWQSFGESLPQRLDRLIACGRMGPVVLAMPDAFTSLGGNQYVDSAVLGNWATYLTTEMVDALEVNFRIRRGREHRGLFGKSSGGYAALVHGMRHADTWGAVASHAGDAGFDLLYRPEFARALDTLARHGEDHDTAIPAFLDALAAKQNLSGSDFHVLMTLAMAASYAPELDAPRGIRLPVDPHTCELDETRWRRWLDHDPAHMADDEACLDGLRSLRGLYIDVGRRDQYFIHYGNRQLARKLAAADVPHRYEEFDGTHSGIDWRYDQSLPFLYAALTGNTSAK